MTYRPFHSAPDDDSWVRQLSHTSGIQLWQDSLPSDLGICWQVQLIPNLVSSLQKFSSNLTLIQSETFCYSADLPDDYRRLRDARVGGGGG